MKITIVEQLDSTLEAAKQAGFDVRYEYFGGTGGGACEYAGRKVLFVDLALSAAEQLEHVQASLQNLILIPAS